MGSNNSRSSRTQRQEISSQHRNLNDRDHFSEIDMRRNGINFTSCMCPQCNRMLRIPNRVDLFRCTCGASLRRPTAISASQDQQRLVEFLSSNQFQVTCQCCHRTSSIPASFPATSTFVCSCGAALLSSESANQLFGVLSSAARRSANHQALVSRLPAYGYKPPTRTRNQPGDVEGVAKEQSCTICLSDYEENDELTMLPCFHSFHKTCVSKWLQDHSSCPLCNNSIDRLLSDGSRCMSNN